MTNKWPPSRDFSRGELIADGAVHAVGLAIALIAGGFLLAMASGKVNAGEYAAFLVYVLALVTVMSVSFAYNLWPQTPFKMKLRRFDHAAIYLLIAATYTPLTVQLPDKQLATGMLLVVWLGAIAGIALKLFLPHRFDRLAIGLYLLLGWSGVVIVSPLIDAIPPMSLWLVVAGGLVYSAGVIFYVAHRLRFQTALWHAFVVTGAGLHLVAVTGLLADRV
jgi:hemolysin III